MKVSQILTNMEWMELAEIKNRYPNFINYIIKRFGDYISRYPEPKFQDLFLSLIINNQAELAFAETLARETTTAIAPDKLGDISTSTATNNSNRTNNSVNSYKGYNVEGDFSKQSNAGDATINSNAKSTSINYFSYLAGINQNRFSDTWKGIIRQFMYLVVTIYLPE